MADNSSHPYRGFDCIGVGRNHPPGGEDILGDLFDVVPKFLRRNINGKSRAKNIFFAEKVHSSREALILIEIRILPSPLP